MPQLTIRVGNYEIDVEQVETAPISLNYKLEDPEQFEDKKSSEALDITVPATNSNAVAMGSYHDPASEDLTADEFFKSARPAAIIANGVEILTGKAFLRDATHTDRPQSYTINCFGNNGDWLVDMVDMTLADAVNKEEHLFTRSVIEASWNYDGASQSADYVYAPARYVKRWGNDNDNVQIMDLKPSISLYWLLYRAFKLLGYTLRSAFFDTPFFRRLVLPWVWGDFLFSDETVAKPYQFRVICTGMETNNGITSNWNEQVSPTGSATVLTPISWTDVTSGGTSGGFEGTGGLYTWTAPNQLKYTYPPTSPLGRITAGFELELYYYIYVGGGSHEFGLYADYYVNGSLVSSDNIHQYSGGGSAHEDSLTWVKELDINPGDQVRLQLRISAGTPGSFSWNWRIGLTAAQSAAGTYGTYPASYWWLKYFKKAIGSPVRLVDYPDLKKHKILDCIRGVVDYFNISMNTDSQAKVVTMEPTHPHLLPGVSGLQSGYFLNERIDWTDKQDLSSVSVMQLYQDENRSLLFSAADDGNDGGVKILNDRYQVEPGTAKYRFPDRFTKGETNKQNRFFSSSVHVRFTPFTAITGVAPQFMALIPENISNTSADASAYRFAPKLAYYKGNVTGAGGWRWQPTNADAVIQLTTLPLMFSVNYGPGGQSDPVLTYGDQQINGVFCQGLLRRFYLERLATMRHGKLYTTSMFLDIGDITNWLHREPIIIRGNTYYLVEIRGFKPLLPGPTECTLWQKRDADQDDANRIFPSQGSVMNNTALSTDDLKYYANLILTTDLPFGDPE